MSRTQETGARAEQAVAEHLRRDGHLLRALNWRDGRYEIDIVTEKEGVIHFVEVKCRKAAGLTTPEEAMTPAKTRALMTACDSYIRQNAIMHECAIDLAAVDLLPDGSMEIRIIPDAVSFGW